MKGSGYRLWTWLGAVACSAFVAVSARSEAVSYRLIEGSTLVDGCPACGRPDFEIRLSGSLEVAPDGANPLFSRWRLINLQFTDGSATPAYTVRGEGWLEIGGEVAVVQRGSLEVEVHTPGSRRQLTLTCPPGLVERGWPMWRAVFLETEVQPTSEIQLTLAAAPVRELWFNTVNGMTSGRGEWPANRITSADILSEAGRRVLDGKALLVAAGVAEAEAALADLDAFDLEPAHPGRVLFSPDREVRSSILGVIREGDLIAVNGSTTVFRRNEALVQAFGLMPPLPDLGLDAVRVQPSGEIWFSLRGSGFSQALGVSIGPGDLLSDAGQLIRSHRGLLAKFQPDAGELDYGLDGFHAWPGGEVWFTVETGFQDQRLGPITDGDLLSDQGYVVARNLDLVREFQPLEDLANFGLQGVFIISDVQEPPAKPSRLNLLGSGTTPVVSWTGPGRVFQVEATHRIGEPFAEASPLLPGREWQDEGGSLAVGSRHYRVRTW